LPWLNPPAHAAVFCVDKKMQVDVAVEVGKWNAKTDSFTFNLTFEYLCLGAATRLCVGRELAERVSPRPISTLGDLAWLIYVGSLHEQRT
jgi:hypothetical protein